MRDPVVRAHDRYSDTHFNYTIYRNINVSGGTLSVGPFLLAKRLDQPRFFFNLTGRFLIRILFKLLKILFGFSTKLFFVVDLYFARRLLTCYTEWSFISEVPITSSF